MPVHECMTALARASWAGRVRGVRLSRWGYHRGEGAGLTPQGRTMEAVSQFCRLSLRLGAVEGMPGVWLLQGVPPWRTGNPSVVRRGCFPPEIADVPPPRWYPQRDERTPYLISASVGYCSTVTDLHSHPVSGDSQRNNRRLSGSIVDVSTTTTYLMS